MTATAEVLNWLAAKSTAGRQLNVAEIGQLKAKLLTKLQAVSVQVQGAEPYPSRRYIAASLATKAFRAPSRFWAKGKT